MPEQLLVGAAASLEHVFTTDDVAAFARRSGDENPIHLDAAAGRSAGFDREVVHGVLVVSLMGRLLGTVLPGPGTIPLGQELRYHRPVYPGDRLRATVEVTNIREDKPVTTLRSWTETDQIVVEGKATVVVRPMRSR